MNSGGGSPQPRFDAAQTAKDQSAANVRTGIANATLSNTNQVTPYGSIVYTESGGRQVGDDWVPSYTATQTLDNTQQELLNRTNNLQKTALDYAGPLLNRVGSTVGSALNFDGAPEIRDSGLLQRLPGMLMEGMEGLDPAAARSRGYDALMSRSRGELDRARGDLKTQLYNQGISEGSEAWKRGMEGQDQALVDASQRATIDAGNLALQDANVASTRGNLFGQLANIEGAGFGQDQARRNQWINEAQTLRNSPLADYQAVMGMGGGVQNPQFVNTTPGQVPMTDVTTPAIAAYQGRMQNAQNQQANQNAMFGGLSSLAGTAATAGMMYF